MSTYFCKGDKNTQIRVRGGMVFETYNDWYITSVSYPDGVPSEEIEDFVIVLKKKPRENDGTIEIDLEE